MVCEVGSGLNGKRPKLRRILSDPSATVVAVEHRDRLAGFGVEHLEAALGAGHGRRIVVADSGETTGSGAGHDRSPHLDVRSFVRAMRAVAAAEAEPGQVA